MTLKTNSRVAGVVFLLYIATGIADIIVSGKAERGADTAARLASIAQHVPEMRVGIILTMLSIFWALILGVTLYALTRDADRDLAMLGLTCRVGEGIVGAIATMIELALLSVATATAGAAAADAATLQATGATLMRLGDIPVTVAATLFAVGSTIFSYLFLRARSIPVAIAWLGVISSALLVVAVPLRGLGLISGTVMWVLWMPALVFELTLAVWLLTKGVAAPRPATAAASFANV